MSEPAPTTSAPLTVRPWSATEFGASKEVWDRLLAASDADPLFMSWDWQWRWWQHHAPVLDAQLQLLALYDGSALVGLAPLYSHRVRVRRLLRRRRLELIGAAWRDARVVFSDYLDLIAAREYRDAVREALAAWLDAQPSWDELVFVCTPRAGLGSALAREQLSRRAYVREVDALIGWRVQLPPSFQAYLERLSSQVRRKLFHQRRKLVEPELQHAAEAEVGAFLGELGRYSDQRWRNSSRTSPPPGRALESAANPFLVDVALCMARAGRLQLTRLRSAGVTLSVMYNIRVGDAVYYLQSGFDGATAHGISPGYLHFGYAIEAACQERTGRFDLLAGPGRHRDYKKDLDAEAVAVVTHQIIRGRLAGRLQAVYEIFHSGRAALRPIRRIRA